jgi:hypothetical protein
VCSISYVLLLDELHKQVATAQTAAALQRALGADVEMPDWFAIREQFDRGLVAPPAEVDDPDRLVLLKALGLR